MQDDAVLLPSTLKDASFRQESCEQRLLKTSAIPFSARFLQKAAVFLSSAFKLGRHAQESYEQRPLVTSTVPSLACCLQYIDVLLPSKLMFGTFLQESRKQRSLRTSTMPSSQCCPVTCYPGDFSLHKTSSSGEDNEITQAAKGRCADLQVCWPPYQHLQHVEPTLATKFNLSLKRIIDNNQVVVIQDTVVSMLLPAQGRLIVLDRKLTWETLEHALGTIFAAKKKKKNS